MSKRSRRDLSLLLHPFMFVLKHGEQIEQDPMNFSLTILHVNSPEIVKSPTVHQIELPVVPPAKADTKSVKRKNLLQKLAQLKRDC